MQPHITESAPNRRSRNSSGGRHTYQPPQVGVVLDQRSEFRHILPAVLTYLGSETLRAHGLERLSPFGGTKQRQLAARMAEIHLFQDNLAAGVLPDGERVFALTADEADAAGAALAKVNSTAQPDVSNVRHRLAGELASCRAPLLREIYADGIQPDNPPVPDTSASTASTTPAGQAVQPGDLVPC